MNRIKRFIAWLRRVPLGVWIFLALTQVLTLVSQSFEIAWMQTAIEEMDRETGTQSVRQRFIENVADKKQTVIEASCLLVLFIALAATRSFSREPAHFTVRDLPLPQFILRDLFAGTFLIAMLAGTFMAIKNSQIPTIFAVPLLVFVLAIAAIGLVAIIIGAIERKAQSEERKISNRQDLKV